LQGQSGGIGSESVGSSLGQSDFVFITEVKNVNFISKY